GRRGGPPGRHERPRQRGPLPPLRTPPHLGVGKGAQAETLASPRPGNRFKQRKAPGAEPVSSRRPYVRSTLVCGGEVVLGARGFSASGRSVERRSGKRRYARSTLPAFMHFVHTFALRTRPFLSLMVILWMLGRNQRF